MTRRAGISAHGEKCFRTRAQGKETRRPVGEVLGRQLFTGGRTAGPAQHRYRESEENKNKLKNFTTPSCSASFDRNGFCDGRSALHSPGSCKLTAVPSHIADPDPGDCVRFFPFLIAAPDAHHAMVVQKLRRGSFPHVM